MPKLSLIVRFALTPALIGLMAAIVIAWLLPQHFPIPIKAWLQDLKSFAVVNTDRRHPSSYADAVERASVSVVNIHTLREQSINARFDPRTGRYRSTENQILPSTGSGVIVSEDGYIVTNLHVLESATEIRVALQDGREATPEIIGFSKSDDMAVLKIDLPGLQAIDIGDPDAARVGDVVLAIGNPFGVGQTVTQGIISGTRRQGLNIATFENFIQTDAAINPGNSGGALVDANGRLLGINIGDLRQTYYGDASGIGFAIPVDRAIQAVNDIVEHGRVVRGWLGVSAIELNENYIRTRKLDIDEGVLLTAIYPNGPADIAGLIAGDIITRINGHGATSMRAAIQEFADAKPGDVITLEVLRNGVTRSMQAVLSVAPAGA